MTSPSKGAGFRPASWNPARLLHPRHPIRSLTFVFCLWKAILFLSVVACPGPGYDTSTTLLADQTPDVLGITPGIKQAGSLSIPLRFVRWDSIYFTHAAENGYVFEQEWAFGYGYTKVLRFLASILRPLESFSGIDRIALTGVVLSHVVHYFSVLALYRLTINVFGLQTAAQRLLAYVSAALHIISPAGAFLSAPYGESLFSFLNLSGFYIYSSARHDDRLGNGAFRDGKVLTAAVFFATATAVRSNGILSGFLFAYDAWILLWRLVSEGLSAKAVVRLGVIILGGCIVATGMIWPQFVAYTTFCTGNVTRPWCQWTIPSIYGWVQEQYWNVGFLKYWTVSNLPLFLLAAPILFILCRSSLWAVSLSLGESHHRFSKVASQGMTSNPAGSLLIQLAIPQGLLAVMAFTSYHVQIINRISSGYPVWYWYLASQILDPYAKSKSSRRNSRMVPIVVQSMVVYGLVQAVLFGSFLPPA